MEKKVFAIVSHSSAVGPLFRSDRVVVRYGAAVCSCWNLRVTYRANTRSWGLKPRCFHSSGGVGRGHHRRARTGDHCNVSRWAARDSAVCGVELRPRCSRVGWSTWPLSSLLAPLVAVILHRLQVAMRAQQHAVSVARAAETKAADSEAQLRLVADGVPGIDLLCRCRASLPVHKPPLLRMVQEADARQLVRTEGAGSGGGGKLFTDQLENR